MEATALAKGIASAEQRGQNENKKGRFVGALLNCKVPNRPPPLTSLPSLLDPLRNKQATKAWKSRLNEVASGKIKRKRNFPPFLLPLPPPLACLQDPLLD